MARARDVQRQARREKKAGCSGGGRWRTKKMLRGPGKVVRVLRAADQEALVRQPPRRLDEQRSSAACRSAA